MPEAQSYKHHARYVPGYHFLLSGILLLNFIWRGVELLRHPSWDAGLETLLGFGFILIFGYFRSFPLKVQDRVIRLEEQLRLYRLLPPDLQPRIAEFTPGQLIALRFASDGELPALARRVLEERIAKRREIKQLIQNWRPDEFRA